VLESALEDEQARIGEGVLVAGSDLAEVLARRLLADGNFSENLQLQARIDRAVKLLTDYDSGGVRVVSVRQVLDQLRPDVQG
jgi:hypothetical protein